MAHDLVFDENGNALMIYRLRNGVGVPWHNEGQGFEDEIRLSQVVEHCGFDRYIRLAPLMAYADIQATELMQIQGSFAVLDSAGRQLGVVGSQYAPLQDHEFIDSLRVFEQSGYSVETAGMLRGGSQVWCQFNTELVGEVRPGDPVKEYLLASNAHDGKGFYQIGRVGTRVVCANTLGAATAEGTLAKLRHSGDIAGKVEQLTQAMAQRFEQDLSLWRDLAGRLITSAELETFCDKFTGRTREQEKRSGGLRDQIVEKFESGIGTRSESLWDALNAVTEIVTHSEGRGKDSAGDKAVRALHSQWFGQGATQIARATQVAASML